MPTLLETKNLTIGYKQGKHTAKKIVENLTLQLQTSKLTVLLGANGMGKSSLLRTFAGLQLPLQGNILLANKPLQDYSMLEKAQNISMVSTEKPQTTLLTVRELVALGRYPHTSWTGKLTAADNQEIDHALESTHIKQFAARYLQTLSDGQLQKALIARALAQNGKLLLLDEPTAHLDLPNKAEIWQLLKKTTQKNNKTILLATHDVEFALQLADVIWLLHQEKLEIVLPNEVERSLLFHQIFDSPYLTFEARGKRFLYEGSGE
jgi:iron complex transport system ATP-binding protein